MKALIDVWQQLPAESRGWIEFWLFSAAVALARAAINRYAPASNARHWIHALDLISNFARSTRPALRDHGGIPGVLLPRVDLPTDAEKKS